MGIQNAEFYAEHKTISETARKFIQKKLHTKNLTLIRWAEDVYVLVLFEGK